MHRRPFLPLFLLLLFLPGLLTAGPRTAEIRNVLERGTGQHAHWGVYAVRASNGEVLADHNSERLFIPASTRKLVPTAMAVRHMGTDKILSTRLLADGNIVGGRLEGDLIVSAVGDPTWTPSLRGGRGGRAVLDQLAAQVVSAGIDTITGDIVIDTSRYARPHFMPPGWEWEDFQTIDGAMPSVFGINRNLGAVTIRPASPGEPIEITFASAARPFVLENRTTTGRPDSVPTFTLFRGLDGTVLRAEGSLASNSGVARRSIPLGQPVEFAAEEFEAALRERAILIRGGVRLSSSRRSGEQVGVMTSAPMHDLLREINRPSDNQLAESLYLLAGAEVFGRGSYEASHQLEDRFWRALGVSENLYRAADGSGLSRHNLLAPKALVELLREMRSEPAFVDSLPVSGRSGTLSYRLSQRGMATRVTAKTGTLTGVVSLAGYVTTNAGDTVVFSIVVNHNKASASAMRSRIDEAVEILAR